MLPVSGPPIDNGIIVINKGKIEAVGKDVPIPADAKVIDAKGKVIVPGFIEAHSTRGMDQVNETNPNVPFLSVVDAIDPIQDYFEECRRQGITTVAIVPGNNQAIIRYQDFAEADQRPQPHGPGGHDQQGAGRRPRCHRRQGQEG